MGKKDIYTMTLFHSVGFWMGKLKYFQANK